MRKGKYVLPILFFLGFAIFCVSGVTAGDSPKQVTLESLKINVNTASLEELSDLKRIGAKYAERIIQYREKHGPFKRIEDITMVPGIGPKTLEVNKDILTVK